MKTLFQVKGMTCSACSARVEKAVKAISGVFSVSVNLVRNNMLVEYEGVTAADIVKAVKQAGYSAFIPKEREEGAADADTLKNRTLLSSIFLIPLFLIAMGPMLGIPMPFLTDIPWLYAGLQLALTTPILIVNRKYFVTGVKALFSRSPNMDTLIALGSGAAYLYGVYAVISILIGTVRRDAAMQHEFMHKMYFESAGMILTLITLGKHFEGRSKKRTGYAIEKLIKLAPTQATVERDGTETVIPAAEVRVNDILIVKGGENIPVDGVVLSGTGSIDTAVITGESIPRAVSTGDNVISGTTAVSGYFKFQARSVGEDTAIQKIVRLVEEAASSKAPISRLADRISGIFVPVVLAIALLSFIIWMAVGESFSFALGISISVLVISCPCALGLATPVSIMVGTGLSAEKGILIKSAEALEILHKVDTVVLDKTGTVTEGRPRVIRAVSEDKRFLSVAYSLERRSVHPLAEAVCTYCEQTGAKELAVTDFADLHGRGLSGAVDGVKYYLGSFRYMEELGIAIDAEEEGYTAVCLSDERMLIGVFYIADAVKDGSKAAVDALRKENINVVMLTGDRTAAAKRTAFEAGITAYFAEVLPGDKEGYIARLQDAGGVVAMVGDGVNDAPALTRADVGIAIGAGTDIAIESADIVLMGSELSAVPEAIRISRRTVRIIRQNLFWAFGYNTLGIPVAAGVLYPLFSWLLNPMIAAACMSLSSLSVVLNALRIRYFQTKVNNKKSGGRDGKVTITD